MSIPLSVVHITPVVTRQKGCPARTFSCIRFSKLLQVLEAHPDITGDPLVLLVQRTCIHQSAYCFWSYFARTEVFRVTFSEELIWRKMTSCPMIFGSHQPIPELQGHWIQGALQFMFYSFTKLRRKLSQIWSQELSIVFVKIVLCLKLSNLIWFDWDSRFEYIHLHCNL